MEDIQNRIALIISTKGMTNAEFAEAINVQPSNISHIMSGRNKPSLDLVMKILKKFPELRTDWLLNGRGAMNRERNLFDFTDDKPEKSTAAYHQRKDEQVFKPAIERNALSAEDKADTGDSNSAARKSPPEKSDQKFAGSADMLNSVASQGKSRTGKRIEKIVIFYADQTFEAYHSLEEGTG
jgi:transcriptional regulator with XRE-family HTH domain